MEASFSLQPARQGLSIIPRFFSDLVLGASFTTYSCLLLRWSFIHVLSSKGQRSRLLYSKLFFFLFRLLENNLKEHLIKLYPVIGSRPQAEIISILISERTRKVWTWHTIVLIVRLLPNFLSIPPIRAYETRRWEKSVSTLPSPNIVNLRVSASP